MPYLCDPIETIFTINNYNIIHSYEVMPLFQQCINLSIYTGKKILLNDPFPSYCHLNKISIYLRRNLCASIYENLNSDLSQERNNVQSMTCQSTTSSSKLRNVTTRIHRVKERTYVDVKTDAVAEYM